MTTRFLFAAALILAGPARAADVWAHFSGPQSLNGKPVMVSIVQDGQVVEQQETKFPENKGLGPLEPGAYDVRAEADGVVTEVKRGVHIVQGKNLDVQFALRPGQGAHVVEYASGGLSREEVAARLAKLEAAVKQLQAQLAELSKPATEREAH